jgi:IS30 family transposase
LSRWSLEDLLAVQAAINSRPRKVLGWKTPAEALDQQLRLLNQADVATTG